MNKKYAIIEGNLVANIVVAKENPSFMTELLCIEVDDTIQIGFIYDGEKFIENVIGPEYTIEENTII